MIMDELGFESVGHMHVMLANPRAGIIKMLALKPGEYTPEEWVPEKVGSYVSSSWDQNVFVAELEKIVDTFGGEGTFKSEFDDEWEDELGLSFREDFLPALTGRISYMNWLNYPVDYSSNVHVFGIHIADMDKFEKVKQAILNRMKDDNTIDRITEHDYRGSTYWTESDEARGQRDEAQLERRRRRARRNGRNPDEVELAYGSYKICIGLIDEVMVVCTSPDFFEAAVDTALGEKPALIDSTEFDETTETVTKLLRNDTPGAIFYQQPGKTMEFFFELAQSESADKSMNSFFDRRLGREEELEEDVRSSQFRMLTDVRRTLEENPLPSYKEIEHLFAPSGGFITNDETGYHLMTFQLKHDR